MTSHYRLHHDGPHLHVTLHDVVPPDWDALRSDVEHALDHGVARTFVHVPAAMWTIDEPRSRSFARELTSAGVRVSVRRLPDPFGAEYLG